MPAPRAQRVVRAVTGMDLEGVHALTRADVEGLADRRIAARAGGDIRVTFHRGDKRRSHPDVPSERVKHMKCLVTHVGAPQQAHGPHAVARRTPHAARRARLPPPSGATAIPRGAAPVSGAT